MSYSIKDVVKSAREYFFERFKAVKPAPTGTFQCWVGGYSSGQDIGEIWRFQIDNGKLGDAVCEADTTVTSTISWGGAPEAINRLVLGYSQELGKALEANGMEKTKIPQAIKEIARHTQANLVNPAMPTADAIDLARFLAETTKQFVRFQPGSNSVGGNIDIATITKHENFKWVARKHFYSTTLNPLETDHA